MSKTIFKIASNLYNFDNIQNIILQGKNSIVTPNIFNWSTDLFNLNNILQENILLPDESDYISQDIE